MEPSFLEMLINFSNYFHKTYPYNTNIFHKIFLIIKARKSKQSHHPLYIFTTHIYVLTPTPNIRPVRSTPGYLLFCLYSVLCSPLKIMRILHYVLYHTDELLFGSIFCLAKYDYLSSLTELNGTYAACLSSLSYYYYFCCKDGHHVTSKMYE